MHYAYRTKKQLNNCQRLQIAHFDLNQSVEFRYFFARLIIMLQFRDCFFAKAMLYLLQSFDFKKERVDLFEESNFGIAYTCNTHGLLHHAVRL